MSELMAPGTGVGNLAGCVHLAGSPAQLPALKDAIVAVLRAHEALRLQLVDGDGPVCQQIIGPPVELHAPVWRLGADRSRLLDESAVPFELLGSPLFRFRLLELEGGRIGWFFVYHHVTIDAWTVALLNKQILRAFATGEPPEPGPSFLDFMAREAAWLQSEDCAVHRAFWHEHLDGLSLEGGGGPVGPIATERYEHDFGPELSDAIRGVCAREKSTVFRFFLALFALHFTRGGREPEAVLATGHHNRLSPAEKAMAGMSVSTLPVRLPVDRDEPFGAMLRRVHRTSSTCLRKQQYPYDLLAQHLRAGGLEPLSLLRTFVNHVPSLPPSTDPAIPPVAVERYSPRADMAELNIKINPNQRPVDAPLQLGVDARLSLHGAADMERFFALVAHLARRVVAEPDRAVGELDRVPERLRSVVVGEQRPVGEHATVDAAFRAAVVAHAERLAVADERTELSYAQLDRAVEALAAELREAGVRPGHRVAVCTGRTVAYVVGLLAVLRAEAAWVPLTPDLPARRRERNLEDAGVRVIVGDEGVLQHRPPSPPAPLPPEGERGEGTVSRPQGEGPGGQQSGGLLAGEAGAVAPVGSSSRAPERGAAAERTAYVLYTSGSTGEPKGALLPHRAVLNLCAWDAARSELQPGERTAAFCSFTFDVSVAEILTPLLCGASVTIVPEAVRGSVTELGRFFRAHDISVAVLPTRVGELFMEHVPDPGLRLLTVGGEQLRARPHPGYRVINCYGPTEACVYSSSWELIGDDDPVPIGGPVANCQAAVVDEHGAVVARGEEGELWLAGAPLALGYLARPALTRAAFVPNPRSIGDHDALAYRTGDRVVMDPAGVLRFLGRVDRQIKLRGFRIELPEIELCLRDAPGVEDCAVVVHGEHSDRALAAFAVGDGIDPDALRQHAAARLPPYMVPASIQLLPALPLTAHGKTDRAQLRQRCSPVAASSAAVAPRSGAERALLDLFQRVLGRDDIGVTDAFFDRGGDSITAMELFALIERETGVVLHPSLIFRKPTVAALAEALAQPREGEDDGALLVLREGASDGHLLCIHDFTCDLMAYTTLLQALETDLTVLGLRWAPGLGDGAESFEDLAGLYIARLRARQPRGPYRLLGYSVGGNIAWEMARQLRAAGEQVAFVGLIDSPNYAVDGEPLDRFVRMLVRTVLSLLRGMTWRYTLQLFTSGLDMVHGGRKVFALMAAQRRLRALARGYRPARLDVPVQLYRSNARRPGLDEDLGWGGLVDRLRVIEIGGDHISVTNRVHGPITARYVQQALSRDSREEAP